jgi:hypothetical protein
MFPHVLNKVVIGKQYVLLTDQNSVSSVMGAQLVGPSENSSGIHFSLKRRYNALENL